jgi:hypothetical protein
LLRATRRTSGVAQLNTQGGLYAEVKRMFLHDSEADIRAILEALATMDGNMTSSAGQDLAVVMFFGHGTGNRPRGVLFVDRQ